MPRIPIADLDDPRLAVYRHLKATNATRDLDQFVVEGEKLVDRLRESAYPVASVLTTDRQADRIGAPLPADVIHYVVPDGQIDALVGYNFHQGALACGLRVPPPALDDLVRAAPLPLTLIVCPRLDNPENLGALVRLADVFGAAAVVAEARCPDPLSRRVLRVSMGTALRVPVIREADLAGAIDRLRLAHGLILAAASTDPAAEPFERLARHRPPRLALVMGSESAGLAPEWLARCDRPITIPMRPGADSLNVAVAAGILLYHLTPSPEPGVPGGPAQAGEIRTDQT